MSVSDTDEAAIPASRVSVPTTAPHSETPTNADTSTSAEPKHTAPLSVLVGTISGMGNAIFPAVIAGFSIGDGSSFILIALLVGLLIAGIGAFFAYISWQRLTYTIGQQDIRVESGVLSRSARSVPYERIQDVSLEQKLLARMFGLVAVKFETGAGGGEDLSLSYLTEDEGERLRQLVRQRRDEEAATATSIEGEETPVAPAEGARVLFAMDPRRLLIFGTFEFSLAVFAVLAGLLQYADTFAGFSIWNEDLWESFFVGRGEDIASMGVFAQTVSALAGLVAVFVVGSLTGMIRVFLREWGFVLERTARGFRRRRGLLTKTDVVMPIHRVQGIKIGTGLLRYRFGWHSLRFVSLAQDAGSASHVVAPFAKMDEIAPIVSEAGYSVPDQSADWHHASSKYRTDSMVKDALLFAVPATIAGPIVAINSPEWTPVVVLILLGLAIISAGTALYSCQFKRHALDANQIMSRAGLLSPQTQIATRLKLHSVEIAQGPLGRLRGYATLHLGLAGGEFQINGVPIDRAWAVRHEIMRTIAATDFSQLERA